MEEAFNTLGTTVGSIAAKITTGKEAAARYKNKIIEKLDALLQELQRLQADAATNSPVSRLRQELQETQQNLQAKTAELATSNSKLEELKSTISNLTSQLKSKEDEINRLDRELADLASEREKDRLQNITDTKGYSDLQEENRGLKENNDQHDAAFSELNAQLGVLRTEKIALEQQLGDSRQELGNFVERIGAINARLAGEIEKINHILDDFGDGTDVSEKIEAVADNLRGIINVINNPVQPRGGRRKTKKMRGGYLYSKKSNSNSSSISRSNSKSSSRSSPRSRTRSRNRSKKNKI